MPNPKIVTADTNFKIQPCDIDTPPGGHFWGAFNNYETEVSARYIVRLCQARGGWQPFTLDEIEAFYNKSDFTFNRLVRPGTAYSITKGYYQIGGGWIIEQNGQYFVTDDFIRRCYNSAPKNSA